MGEVLFLAPRMFPHLLVSSGNVLLKSSRQDQRGFVAKISDFGLSRVLHTTATSAAAAAAPSSSEGNQHILATAASECGSGGGSIGGGDFMSGALDGTVPYLAPELINNGQRSKASDVWAYGMSGARIKRIGFQTGRS